jgi:hypothetical protein
MMRAFLVASIALLLAAPLAAQTPPSRLDLTWTVDGPLANLRIAPVPPVDARLETRGREAILRFAGPVAPVEAGGLLRDLARFVESAGSGFDSLLIVGTPDTVAVLRREGPDFVLVLRLPDRPADAAETGGDAIVVERAEKRLERLRASVESQTGQNGVALGRLAKLARDDAGDVETLVQLAGLERQIGRPLRAADLLSRAALLDPDNAEIARARAELARGQRAFLRVEPEYRRNSAGEKRYTTGTLAEAPITASWRATAAFDQVFVDSPGVRRTDGLSQPFKGPRQRGAVGLAYSAEDGKRLHGQIFANAKRAGAGLAADFAFDDARLGTGIEIARPYWDFTESLVSDGTRDRVFAEYTRPYVLGLSARVRAGLNRYGLPGRADGARSAAIDGELRLPLDGYVRGAAVAYVFDGEYPWRIASVDDPFSPGTEYRPVPLRYREVHGLLASYTLDWRQAFDSDLPLAIDVSAGPAYDRYGHRGGPLLGGGVTWLGEGPFEGGLRASYGRGVGRDASAFTTIGGYATWRM